MIHVFQKKKFYVRPKLELTWMENEDTMITGTAHGQPFDPSQQPEEPDRSGAKLNVFFDDDFEETDEWGYEYESLW